MNLYGRNDYYRDMVVYQWIDSMLDCNFETLEVKLENEVLKEVSEINLDYD